MAGMMQGRGTGMRESEWDTVVREPLALAAPDARVLVLIGGEAGTGKSWFVR